MSKIETIAPVPAYEPTVYVNNSEPDLDETHLNKTEQALKRVTDAANEAIAALKELNTVKISTSQIVNNLLATDPNTVLAGPMGKTLSDKDADLQRQVTQLNGELGHTPMQYAFTQLPADFLNGSFFTFRIVTNSTNASVPHSPLPDVATAQWYNVLTLGNPGRCTQIAYFGFLHLGHDNTAWIRTQHDFDVTPWTEMRPK